MSNVLMPRLLNPATMQETKRLNPSGLSINLTQDPVSTADMTIEMQDAVIPMRSWIELFTIHGSVGIFRVSQSEMSYDSDEQRMTLEHGLCSLNDTILRGDEEEGKTPREWLTELLSKQTLWSVGTVAASDTVYLTPGDSTALDLLTEMMDQLSDYIITTDQSSLPWRLNIVAKSSTVQAEGRLSRNLTSARVSYDDSDLCTRVYAYGLPNEYLDADTVSTYGVVEQYMPIDEQSEEEEALRFARQWLKKRKEPSISIELDAVDLSQATGESLDSFTIGKKFRLALPAYGVTVEEWITAIDYADVYGEPEHVTLTLANEVADLSQRMAKAQATANSADSRSKGNSSSARRNAGGIAQNVERLEHHDKYITVLEDEDIAVWRETSATVEVGDAYAAMKTMVYDDTYGAYIDKNDFVNRLRTAGIEVDAKKSLVEILATEQVTTTQGISSNSAAIQVNAQGISTKVEKNGVISAINQSAEAVTIQASKINLDGYVTTSSIKTVLANAGALDASQLTVGSGGFTCNSYVRILSHNVSWKETDIVKSISVNTDSQDNIAITYDGSTVAGGRSFNYVRSVSKSTDTIHYLGY